ncbi:MAG: Ig-like domain-containing protein, partial [Bacteroidota bacterium]
PTPSGICDTATVTIYIQPADDLAAVDDDFSTEKDEPVSGNVLANDQNPDGSDLTVSLLPGSQPAHGDLILNPDGTFTYLPDPGFTGTDAFQYLVCEILTGICDTATVTLQVNPELEAVNDEFLLAIGSPCGGDVLLNDTIPGGGGAAFAQIIPGTGPNHGTVSMQPNGAFNYLPNPGFSGTDSFQYMICLQNAPAICDTATVKLTVFQGVPPIPQTDCATAQVCPGENIVLNVAASFSGTNLNYRWKNGNGETVSTSPGLVLAASSPLAVPPFSALVQVNGLWSEASVPCYVQVGVAPVAQISNPGAVCPGGSLQLAGSGSPGGGSNNTSGFQYEWRQVGQPAILGTQPVLQLSNITQSTTYELTVTNAACGVSTSTTTTVEVLPGVSVVNLNGGGTYCHGSVVTLNGNASTSGGAGGGIVSYTWTGPNNFYFTQTAPPQGPFPLMMSTLIPENEGSYTLTVSTLAGCVSTPLSTIVDYVPQPATPELTLSDDFACQGDQLELNSTLATGNVVVYRWFFQPVSGGVLPLTATNVPTIFINSAQPANTGVYSVAVSVDGCLSDTSNLEPLTVLSNSLSISATNPTSARDPACEGEDVALAAPIVPGATYNWYGPQGFHSTLPNPVVPEVGEENEGSYLVLVNEPQCGVTLQASTVLFVSPAPATPILTSNSPVC